MYNYQICNEPDEDIFNKQCVALEKAILGISKGQLLEDVDGTLIQEYTIKNARILVFNDEYIGSIHIKSEIDLNPFFNLE